MSYISRSVLRDLSPYFFHSDFLLVSNCLLALFLKCLIFDIKPCSKLSLFHRVDEVFFSKYLLGRIGLFSKNLLAVPWLLLKFCHLFAKLFMKIQNESVQWR